jgi:hypothetical protein
MATQLIGSQSKSPNTRRMATRERYIDSEITPFEPRSVEFDSRRELHRDENNLIESRPLALCRRIYSHCRRRECADGWKLYLVTLE